MTWPTTSYRSSAVLTRRDTPVRNVLEHRAKPLTELLPRLAEETAQASSAAGDAAAHHSPGGHRGDPGESRLHHRIAAGGGSSALPAAEQPPESPTRTSGAGKQPAQPSPAG